MSTTLENLIEKLPPELQEVAKRYASMLGADANKDDLMAIFFHVLKHNHQYGYDIISGRLRNDELAEIHSNTNTRLRELFKNTGDAPGMPQLIAEDLVGILVRFGILALLG